MDISLLDHELNVQKNNLRILQECLKSFNTAIQRTNYLENSDDITELLKELKTNLDNCRNNINNLESLKEQYLNSEHSNESNNSNDSNNNWDNNNNDNNNWNNDSNNDNNNSNLDLSNLYNQIINTSNDISPFLLKYIKKTSFILNNTLQKQTPSTNIQPFVNIPISSNTNYGFDETKNVIENLTRKPKDVTNSSVNENLKKYEIRTTSDENTKIENPDNLHDNKVLLISEKKNKIFLPYTVDELNKLLARSKSCKTTQDVINKYFTLPFDAYKNSTISRFKETYNLMRKKEKASVLDSLDLAIELSFNYRLNPAVIIACKSLEELDTYLDCLELNELNKFNYFEVKYESYPTK